MHYRVRYSLDFDRKILSGQVCVCTWEIASRVEKLVIYYMKNCEQGDVFFSKLLSKQARLLWAFHPIFVTWFLVVLGDKVTKILRNSLFIFHFVLPILPCKWKTLYRKSRNLSDKKAKTMLQKMWWARHLSNAVSSLFAFLFAIRFIWLYLECILKALNWVAWRFLSWNHGSIRVVLLKNLTNHP